MRRLACLLILGVLTGCPEGPTESPPTPPTPPATTTLTPAGTDPVDQDTPKEPEGLDTSSDAENAIGLMAKGKDPVCGMDVDLNNAASTHVFGDATFVFCNDHCAETFKKEPKKYAK